MIPGKLIPGINFILIVKSSTAKIINCKDKVIDKEKGITYNLN